MYYKITVRVILSKSNILCAFLTESRICVISNHHMCCVYEKDIFNIFIQVHHRMIYFVCITDRFLLIFPLSFHATVSYHLRFIIISMSIWRYHIITFINCVIIVKPSSLFANVISVQYDNWNFMFSKAYFYFRTFRIMVNHLSMTLLGCLCTIFVNIGYCDCDLSGCPRSV